MCSQDGKDSTTGNLRGRYNFKARLGVGAYGEVFDAVHLASGTSVAVKVVTNIGTCDNATRELACRRALIEIRLLRHFDHPNIVKLLETVTDHGRATFSSFGLVLERMDTDLCTVIHGKMKYILLDEHHRYFTYQLFRALKAIHSAGVVHRDLKPANLLIDIRTSTLKICDFGLACEDFRERKTHNIATVWYRAPEILSRPGLYDSSLDVWSAGCIVAEMITKKILFQGEGKPRSICDQLVPIFKILGNPKVEDLMMSEEHWMTIRWILESHQPFKAQLWSTVLRNDKEMPSLLAVDFIRRLLVWNPSKRLTAQAALSHDYVGQYADPDRDPIAAPPPLLTQYNRDMHCEYFRVYVRNGPGPRALLTPSKATLYDEVIYGNSQYDWAARVRGDEDISSEYSA